MRGRTSPRKPESGRSAKAVMEHRRSRPRTIIVMTGGIGSGKTAFCLRLRQTARDSGVAVGGIISPRRFEGGRLVGYDGMDCATGDLFPLAAIPEVARGSEWSAFAGVKYRFSVSGIARANELLEVLASSTRPPTVVFVDEVGKLEMGGQGLYMGFMGTLRARVLPRLLIISCRLEAASWAQALTLHLPAVHLRWTPERSEDPWGLLRSVLD